VTTTGGGATAATAPAARKEDPNAPVCLCQVRTPEGLLADACVRTAKEPRCTCLNKSRTRLCPFVLVVTNDGGVRLPDGAKSGAHWCVDRTRPECDPLTKMPASCGAYTKLSAVDGSACRGYVRGQVEGDEMEEGTYECDRCDWTREAPKFHGQNGDVCEGFERRTGVKLSGRMRGCHPPEL
jgi:hypothetical protein